MVYVHDLKMSSLNLVLMSDDNGEQTPSYDENGSVLMHNVEDDVYVYVPLSEKLVETYPQLRVPDEVMDTSDVDDSKQKCYRTYDATIMLINKYREYYKLFADSLHKNTEVWDKIAEEFIQDGYSFCGKQCENRWKYIRAKYIKKKENVGAGSTGAEAYHFEYFNEIDDILGKKPNVVPKYLASSEGHRNNIQRTPSNGNKNSSRADTNLTSSVRSSAPVQKNQSANPSSTIVSNSDSTQNPTNEMTSSSVAKARNSSHNRRRLSFGDDGGFTGVQAFFDDDGSDEEEVTPEEKKGKRRKEPWEENVQRQDRYHADMMQIQRESMDMFKDFMTQILDCFNRN